MSDITASPISPKKTNHEESPRLLKTLSELRSHSAQLFAKAVNRIQIYSDALDPKILNEKDIEHTLIKFIKQNRHAKIQILIKDELLLRGIDHQLVKLAQQFTSFVEIKVLPKEYHENIFAFYLIDNKQMIYRSSVDNHNAELIKSPHSLINEKSKLFNTIWQSASPASFLRALHL